MEVRHELGWVGGHVGLNFEEVGEKVGWWFTINVCKVRFLC